MGLFEILKKMAKGKSLARILMNAETHGFSINGKILDIGGGSNPSYIKQMNMASGSELVSMDLIHPQEGRGNIDLEHDAFPYLDASIDCILMMNILEHLYNYNHMLSESFRVLKISGTVLGFVPFMVNVHPDPHDYFRYTDEALKKIFNQNGFAIVRLKTVGGGPFYVQFNNIGQMFPKYLRMLCFTFYYFADKLAVQIKPSLRKRFPLGYLFELKKP
jgi:hypothetical protein